MRNMVNLMPLPPPIEIPSETIDRSDKHITFIPDHIVRQDSVAISSHTDNAKDDRSETIAPPHNHHKFVCITIDDSEDESDQMPSPAQDRHEYTSLLRDHTAKDNSATSSQPPATHQEFTCITIGDSREPGLEERDITAEDTINQMRPPLGKRHEFVCITIDDSEDESDQMLPPATDRHEARDNLAERPLPPAIHHEFVCITIDDDSEDESDEMPTPTTHRHDSTFLSNDDGVFKDEFAEVLPSANNHDEFVYTTVDDDEDNDDDGAGPLILLRLPTPSSHECRDFASVTTWGPTTNSLWMFLGNRI